MILGVLCRSRHDQALLTKAAHRKEATVNLSSPNPLQGFRPIWVTILTQGLLGGISEDYSSW